jgi:CRISPR-associated exonuclease Cas4
VEEIEYIPIYSLAEWHYCPRSAYLSWFGSERKDEVTPSYQRMREAHKVSDTEKTRRKKNSYNTTATKLINKQYGVIGKADAIEWVDGIPIPVEYKNCLPVPPLHINAQITLQAMCLEEMYNIKVERGFVFRIKEKRRVIIEIDEGIRNTTIEGLKAFREALPKGIGGYLKSKQTGCLGCIYRSSCWPNEFYDVDNE